MVPGKERMKNNPQSIRFFHPGSKTAENHIVPVSILQPTMRKVQGLKKSQFWLLSCQFFCFAPDRIIPEQFFPGRTLSENPS